MEAAPSRHPWLGSRVWDLTARKGFCLGPHTPTPPGAGATGDAGTGARLHSHTPNVCTRECTRTWSHTGVHGTRTGFAHTFVRARAGVHCASVCARTRVHLGTGIGARRAQRQPRRTHGVDGARPQPGRPAPDGRGGRAPRRCGLAGRTLRTCSACWGAGGAG